MAKKSARQTIVSIPIVGYAVRVLSNVASLPKTRDQAASNQLEVTQLLNELKAEQLAQGNKLNAATSKLEDKLASLQVAQDGLKQELTGKSATKTAVDDKLFADDHLMDAFYTGLEDRFRGSEAVITERLKEYLPYFKNSELDFKKTPVVDIGSGRGELLKLLEENKINAVGLDINYDMVKRSKKAGLQAVQGDALSYLQRSKAQSLGAITGFHIVEHIPFNVLFRIFENAHRTLVDDGFVIFETPNPENLTVGSMTFYMDPSHLHPLPPDLMAFVLETCGFRNIEIKRLHSDDKKAGGLPADVTKLLYGPRDYAVIGYK